MKQPYEDCGLPYQTGMGPEDEEEYFDPSCDDGGYSRTDEEYED